jgi:hypothetical protein
MNDMALGKSGDAMRITSADVEGRREAQALARTDVRRAFAVARAIRHPWYRCQALSSVAETMPATRERDAVLARAVDAAFEQSEPNRIATVGSWPLRVMVRLGDADANRLVAKLVAVLEEEPHGLRRLDGLAAVLAPLLPFEELRANAWRPFLAAAQLSTGWRTERIVSWMAVALSEFDRPAALRLLKERGANRFTTRARTAIDAMPSDAKRMK